MILGEGLRELVAGEPVFVEGVQLEGYYRAVAEARKSAAAVLRQRSSREEVPVADFVLSYATHFGSKLVHERGTDIRLCADNPFEPIRARNQDPEELMESLGMMKYFVTNLKSLVTQFAPMAREIFESIARGQNVAIVTNHISLANIPLIITLLHLAPGAPEDVMDKIWTVLGPALMMNVRERTMVTSMTNVLLTQPSTKNGQMEEFPGLQKRCRVFFRRALRQKTKVEDGEGKIFIIAPSGTRDKVFKDPDGTVRIEMLKPASATESLIDKMDNTLVLPVSVDDRDLYVNSVPQKTDVGLFYGDMMPARSGVLMHQMNQVASLLGNAPRLSSASFYEEVVKKELHPKAVSA